MIDNSIEYRGLKVDKMALECDKLRVDEFIDKLYQPERLNPEDQFNYTDTIAYKLQDKVMNELICDSPNNENK